MPRKKGNPAYEGKNIASSYCVTRQAWIRLGKAERRTGKSKSDIIQHCLVTQDTVDTVTRATMEALSGGVAAPPAAPPEMIEAR